MTRMVSPRVGGLCLVFFAMAAAVEASVSLSGTRLIFDGRYPEATLQVTNRGAGEVLIQTRLSDPRDDDDTPFDQRQALPFAVTPHLQRLAPGSRQTLRIFYQGEGMPNGRESLLHLYVTQVPRRIHGEAQLNIAIRQRINVFFRPTGLEGDPASTAETLRWSLSRSAPDAPILRVVNPTPYHVALQELYLDGVRVSESHLLEPGARYHWTLSATGSGLGLRFKALTDYGGQRVYCARLDTTTESKARLRESSHSQESC